MSTKRVSMKQIAEKLNISPGAVSLTLNGRGDEMRIANETQRLILETAKEMGYPLEKVRKNRQTIGVNNLPVVVVFMPALKGDVISPYDRVMNGLNDCIKNNDINVEIIVCPFEYGCLFKKYKYISSSFCTGAIIFSLSEKDMEDLLNADFDIPIVLFNRINNKYSTVYVDDYNVGYNVAKMFHRKWCKKACIFTPDYRNKPMMLRKIGFEDGCRDYNITLQKNHNVYCKTEDSIVEEYVTSMCDEGDIPDMIFANIDDVGLSLIKALKSNNIQVPENIEIISYGDNAWTKAVTPAMSTIRLDIEKMSGECLTLLWDIIRNGDWRPIAKIFQSEVVFRESFIEDKINRRE